MYKRARVDWWSKSYKAKISIYILISTIYKILVQWIMKIPVKLVVFFNYYVYNDWKWISLFRTLSRIKYLLSRDHKLFLSHEPVYYCFNVNWRFIDLWDHKDNDQVIGQWQ